MVTSPKSCFVIKLFFVCLMVLATGCGTTAEKNLIGKWKSDEKEKFAGDPTVEFRSDGRVFFGGEENFANWTMPKDGELKIQFSNEEDDVQAFYVKFENGQLIMTEIYPPNQSTVFEKVN